jgi:D-serine deaminase-like pyridoxal phosphate-dependent protein
LFVQTTVVSANLPGLATTDAGLKSFATDAGAPLIVDGSPPAGARYVFLGDEQGGLEFSASAPSPAPGAIFTCTVPHCDPTVNLHDIYHVVRGDELVDIWLIEARGKSQ